MDLHLQLVVQPLLLRGPNILRMASACRSWSPVMASNLWNGHQDFPGAADCGCNLAACGAAPAPERA